MGFFSFFKIKNANAFDNPSDKARKKIVEKLLSQYKSALKTIKTTVNASEFFESYSLWHLAIDRITEEIPPKDIKKWRREYPEIFEFDRSEAVRTKLQIAFVRRALSCGVEDLKSSITAYLHLMTPAAVVYCESEIGKISIPCPKENEHIFCRVSFYYSPKYYYYLTDDSSLSPGDEVIVPTGDEDKYSIGTITRIEYHTADDAPYPLDKIKRIIRKA